MVLDEDGIEPYNLRNMADFFDYLDNTEEPEQPLRDTKIDEAKRVLMSELFLRWPKEVFYGRQIEVLLEDRFFHWITTGALGELADEGVIRSEKMRLEGPTMVRFYWLKKNRYWTRHAKAVLKLIRAYSRTDLTRAFGNQAEMMFTAGLSMVGFKPTAKDVRVYKGKRWEETDHDLDRVFERDSIAYGTEIKNKLEYIDRDEVEIKIRMCKKLHLRPLFIMRMAPKSYIEWIRQEGGFSLIFKYQLYPYGQESLAREVRERLRLPVDCPRVIAEGTIQRFLKWHLKQLN